MDLEELGCAYEGAVRQIGVLDTCLTGLLQRRGLTEEVTRDPAITTDLGDTDFSYLSFKIDILAGVKRAYETFRDQKWDQLQRECSQGLQEIIQSQTTFVDMPTDPAHLEDTPTPSSRQHNREIDMDVEMMIHEIPVPLSPLDDDDEMMEVDMRREPRFSFWSRADTDMDGMTGFPRD